MERLRQPVSAMQVVIVLVLTVLIISGILLWRSRQRLTPYTPPPSGEVPAYPVQGAPPVEKR